VYLFFFFFFFQKRRFFSSAAGKPRANARVEGLAHLVAKDLKPTAKLSDVIKSVWSNEVVTSQCPDLVIRLTTLRGSVSQHVWQSLGHDPNEVCCLNKHEKKRLKMITNRFS
jgi:hypothetical protein